MSCHTARIALLAVVGMAPLAACSSTIRKPAWCNPGTAAYQREEAEQFDPYPQYYEGTALTGGRPREFSTPRNEVTRARQYYQSQPWGKTPTPRPLY